MESKYNKDSTMSILSAQDIHVVDIKHNVYGISSRGKDMIFCDVCKICYHIVCLCIHWDYW